jgi:hypothetical protein
VRLLPTTRLVAVLVAATFSYAHAQTNTTPEQPFVYPSTVSTSPVQVLPHNDQRRSVEFCNPNVSSSSTNCAVCPVRSRSDGAAITCSVGGAGSVSLPPSWCWGKKVSPQESALKTAWNAVCSSSSGFTALETE